MKLLLRNWPRLLGVALVALLLVRADLSGVADTLGDAHVGGLLIAFALLFPLVLLKSLRWQLILAVQGVRLGTVPAYLSYMGSMFLGVVTPGRVGEFARIFHVTEEHGVSRTFAFSSVLADRLFDLYLLLILGALALAAITGGGGRVAIIVAIAVGGGIPLVAVFSDTAFGWILVPVAWVRKRTGKLPWRIFDLLVEVRKGLRAVTGPALAASAVLTAAAYALFFTQAYLIARAAGIDSSFVTVALVIALGSLVAILPVSISGLGTRDAVIVAYLGTDGVQGDSALGFSILIFLVFVVGSGLIGAAAWLAKPVKLGALKS
jgi:uncharacterized protein (TIRG00374 family)